MERLSGSMMASYQRSLVDVYELPNIPAAEVEALLLALTVVLVLPLVLRVVVFAAAGASESTLLSSLVSSLSRSISTLMLRATSSSYCFF